MSESLIFHDERPLFNSNILILSYFMVSPTSQQTRTYDWVSRNLPANTTIDLNDLTSMYTVINVVGPKASALLNELSNNDMKFPAFSYRKFNVGYASDVMVMSFTHTGEPGFCLYVPSEYALHIYYKLMTVSALLCYFLRSR